MSIVMPVLNEELRVARALDSLARQDYPSERMEIFISEGGSTDRTMQVVEGFRDRLSIEIVDNSRLREAEIGKTLGLEKASGDVVFFLDADMWLPSDRTLGDLIWPLTDDPSLAGSIAPYTYSRETSIWTRYLSYDEFQRDPLIEVLTPGIHGFLKEERDGYQICEFNNTRIPPIGGTTLYWRADIDPHRWDGYWREVDHPVHLIKKGRNRFAYVPSAGLVHAHSDTLRDMIRKRVRNLLLYRTSYIQLTREPDFVWIDASNRAEVRRLIRWVIGTNLLLPRLLEGLQQARLHRSWEPLLRPVVAIAVTDSLIWALLMSPEGREFVVRTATRVLHGVERNRSNGSHETWTPSN